MARRGTLAASTTALLLLCACVLSVVCPGSSTAQTADAKAGPATQPGDQTTCRYCHAPEVEGFARSKMSRSMRLPGQEPSGIVKVPGTTITMYSDKQGSWQRLESQGTSLAFHVDYVVGSGTHAMGYLTSVANHLFQSPVAYYTSRSAYDLAPAFDKVSDPDFTRPIEQGCVFCHAGSFDAVAGTINEYAPNPFPHLAISCDRCHGPAAAHLANPGRQTIVNPARLEASARDSVCEQCHLIGVARVLNPGKQFSDFHAGTRLEETFTIYRNQAPKDPHVEFRVISHAEQLALSRCKRESGDKMWCGTCHDPHNEPTDAAPYYRTKCLQCHAQTSFASDHPAKTSNCIGCHMPTRQTTDGGHTAFTDHRIQARPNAAPAYEAPDASATIVPWREPPADLAARNLGIASVKVGLQKGSRQQLAAGYGMLAQLQGRFTQDSELFNTMGYALMAGQNYPAAAKAFQLAVKFDPGSSQKETNLGQAYASAGATVEAETHLEKALHLDPLNLTATGLLIDVYNRNGEASKADQLSKRLASIFQKNTDLNFAPSGK